MGERRQTAAGKPGAQARRRDAGAAGRHLDSPPISRIPSWEGTPNGKVTYTGLKTSRYRFDFGPGFYDTGIPTIISARDHPAAYAAYD